MASKIKYCKAKLKQARLEKKLEKCKEELDTSLKHCDALEAKYYALREYTKHARSYLRGFTRVGVDSAPASVLLDQINEALSVNNHMEVDRDVISARQIAEASITADRLFVKV